MPGQLTRRSTLALLGGVALAGCSSFSDERYWEDPPSFDPTGFESVTRASVPARPDPIPVAIADAQRRAFRDHVADLLAPIPEPLTSTTVPNGEVRQSIVDNRQAARAALDRLSTASDTLSVITAAADAGQHAAKAAGIWATITTTGSPETITSSASELRGEISRVLSALPDVATGPEAGAVIYGSIEAPLDEARRSSLVGRPTSIDAQANPLRVGRLLGDLERIRVELRAGEHVHDRYVDSIERPRSVENALSTAVTELAPRLRERIEELHATDTDRPRLQAPDLDGLIERRYQRDEPGVRLLANKLYDFFDELRFVAIAWPGVDGGMPSLRIRNTYWAFSVLTAVDQLRTRINDGDELFPPDATTVRAARSASIDAVATLGGSASPFERWLGWRLVPEFDAPDKSIDSGSGADRQVIARAYGEYVWLRTLARAVVETTPTVAAALAE